ncbi:MAG: hypothetical protein EP330_13110 [Deltaproteobacteria bacterium]|nr:MAG: hypothetical protein EP330_13110 [Deltaproteobacteria bacterium]
MIWLALLACGPSQSLDDVSFMLGKWESRDARGLTQERWIRDGESMFGAGRFTSAASGQVRTESLRITIEGGKLVYRADPGGGEVAFHVDQLDEHSVTFVNPSHDFPQLIGYALDGERLTARISGSSSGKTGEQTWTFSREAETAE